MFGPSPTAECLVVALLGKREEYQSGDQAPGVSRRLLPGTARSCEVCPRTCCKLARLQLRTDLFHKGFEIIDSQDLQPARVLLDLKVGEELRCRVGVVLDRRRRGSSNSFQIAGVRSQISCCNTGRFLSAGFKRPWACRYLARVQVVPVRQGKRRNRLFRQAARSDSANLVHMADATTIRTASI